MTLGVDVGGTFTDVVRWEHDRLRVGKTSTTPDQSVGIVSGCRALDASAEDGVLLHGTTVATNALLERRGAATVLVTDSGFADLIEIARQDRPSLYDAWAARAAPLVDRGRRVEVDRGAIASSPAAVDALVAAVTAHDPEAVAVCLLDAHADPADERTLGAALEQHLDDVGLGDVPVSVSHRVVGEFREYERTSTTVLNAYLTPVVRRYLTRLADTAADAGLPSTIEVMRSSGGLMPLPVASELPAAALLSGPAGGVVAAAALGRALGHDTLVSFDMGGTSTDVCGITGGAPEVAYEREIAGLACRMPAVAVHTVGAGGGSTGWVDGGGALRVGPSSAGAWPGPACYGRGGTDATVTDANVLLGRIDPHALLAGEVPVDADAARRAVAALAEHAGLDPQATARGMIRVVEAHMARAIRTVSVERGTDPRGAQLVSFGGAGGLHATALARELGMAGVLVPPHAGVFSALGLLLSPRRSDRARGVRLAGGGVDALPGLAAEVVGEARASVAGPRVEEAVVLDVRYVGQAHETAVAYTPGEPWDTVAERFHAAHALRNGYARRSDPVEVVAVRAEVTAPPAMAWEDLGGVEPHGEVERAAREVSTGDGGVQAPVWWRPALVPGTEVVGPAVVEEPAATTWLGPGDRARVHDSGTLEVTW